MSIAKVATVLPDVVGFDKCFDYLVPKEIEDVIRVGSIVRISLQNRSVKGFVLDIEIKESEYKLLPIKKFLSVGPSEEVVELCRFGAELYCGRLRSLLVSAKPPGIVASLKPQIDSQHNKTKATLTDISLLSPESSLGEQILPRLREALVGGTTYLEIPPLVFRSHVMLLIYRVLREMQFGSNEGRNDALSKACLVLTALRKDVRNLATYLRKANIEVAEMPDDWAKAAGGAEIVLGSRQAVFAPVTNLGAVVIFDAHHEAYQEERTPSWKATRLAIERARAAGVPCILISPIADIYYEAPRITLPPPIAVGAWPYVQVIDRRQDDPRSGLYSPLLRPLVDLRLQEDPDMSAVFIYNRKGNARLLTCQKCGEVARCEFCRGACEIKGRIQTRSDKKKEINSKEVSSHDDFLSCKLCGRKRPQVCVSCGSTEFNIVQPGVDKVAKELSLLLGRDVEEITAGYPVNTIRGQVLVGTEAVLYSVRRASVVVFLDIDQDLLRPRYKSGEKVLSQLATAARLLAPRSSFYGNRDIRRRIVLQTRMPDHPVLLAAKAGDPSLFWEQETKLRKQLQLPPYSALALISGVGALDAIKYLEKRVEVAEYGKDSFLVRAKDEQELASALKGASLPKKNVKVTVDPDDV